MGQYFDNIPGWLIPWINAQKIFWVATAPLSESGHVNVSPKGFEKTMHIVLDDSEDGVRDTSELDTSPESSERLRKATSSHVWYEDLTGSGVETISHLRENERITVLFTAFEGPPRICRLFGTGKVYEFGTPEYDALLPPEKRQPGSRAVIWIDVHKVGTSCGYSIPFFTYKAPRMRLHTFFVNKEQQDFDYSCELAQQPESESMVVIPSQQSSTAAPSDLSSSVKTLTPSQLPPENKGIKNYWKLKNLKSQDGLPGLLFAYSSPKEVGDWRGRGISFKPDDESTPAASNLNGSGVASGWGAAIFASDKVLGDVGKVLVGFGAGVVVTSIFARAWAR